MHMDGFRTHQVIEDFSFKENIFPAYSFPPPNHLELCRAIHLLCYMTHVRCITLGFIIIYIKMHILKAGPYFLHVFC